MSRTNTKSPNDLQVACSWRKHFEPHPSALVFHRHTTDEQRRELQADIKERGLQLPIVTASVPGEKKVYIIDGITRLDVMEEGLGWQIVNENGEWIGALETKTTGRPNVIHHYGYTHEKIAELVISLNAKRRHTEKLKLAQAIVALAKAQVEAEVRVSKVVSRHDGEKFPNKRGRSKDPVKSEAVKQTAAHGISTRTLERALSEQSSKPRKPKRFKSEPSFEDRVWSKWSPWLKRWSPTERGEVKRVVHEFTAPN